MRARNPLTVGSSMKADIGLTISPQENQARDSSGVSFFFFF